MPSLSENLSNVKDNLLQRVLEKLFSGFVTTAPDAITATAIAAAVPAAAPAGGTGAAAGGWDNATNRDAAITTINGLRTHAIEMDLDFEALLVDVAALRTTVASLAANITA